MHPCRAWAPGRARKIEFRLTREHFFKNFVNFGVMQETFPSVGIFVKRIARHNRYIPGQVVTWSRAENCSRVKRIHRFSDILIFLNHLPRFLTRHLELNFPCTCITLGLERLYESCGYLCPGVNAILWCVSPRQGPKNWASAHQKALFQKFY